LSHLEKSAQVLLPPITLDVLEELYCRCNRREYIHPDPLEFLYAYDNPQDRELSGLIASALAYGRVAQILKSASFVLDRMNPSPSRFLRNASEKKLLSMFSDFKHRFTTGRELIRMLLGAKIAIERYGSLHECFVAGLGEDDDNVLEALSFFVEALSNECGHGRNSLLPTPAKGSACKRLNLFLRWMVRNDDVDPGGWDKVPPSKLIIPLDTHMHRICRLLSLTTCRQANMRTALEITRAFAGLIPDDPTRYDFVLTRFGIRNDMKLEGWLKRISL
jgi:uncharacterized protein (TIGR02757 family)